MVKTTKKWNRHNNSRKLNFSSSEKFKVSRLPVRKRKSKFQGYSVIEFSLYGFFSHDNNIKQGLNNGQS